MTDEKQFGFEFEEEKPTLKNIRRNIQKGEIPSLSEVASARLLGNLPKKSNVFCSNSVLYTGNHVYFLNKEFNPIMYYPEKLKKDFINDVGHFDGSPEGPYMIIDKELPFTENKKFLTEIVRNSTEQEAHYNKQGTIEFDSNILWRKSESTKYPSKYNDRGYIIGSNDSMKSFGYDIIRTMFENKDNLLNVFLSFSGDKIFNGVLPLNFLHNKRNLIKKE